MEYRNIVVNSMFRIRALAQCGTIKNILLILLKNLGILSPQQPQSHCHCSQWTLVAYLNNLSLITEILMKKMIIFSDKLQECNKIFQMIIKIVIIKLGSMDHYQSSSSTIFLINTQLQTQEALKFMFAILKQIGMILLKLIRQLQWLQSFSLIPLEMNVIGCSIRLLLVH